MVYVIDKGCICENGTWQELIKKPNGLFRKMAELQKLKSEQNYMYINLDIIFLEKWLYIKKKQ